MTVVNLIKTNFMCHCGIENLLNTILSSQNIGLDFSEKSEFPFQHSSFSLPLFALCCVSYVLASYRSGESI